MGEGVCGGVTQLGLEHEEMREQIAREVVGDGLEGQLTAQDALKDERQRRPALPAAALLLRVGAAESAALAPCQ